MCSKPAETRAMMCFGLNDKMEAANALKNNYTLKECHAACSSP